MAPKKPNIEEFEPFACNDCSNTWDKKRNARKQCPKCGAANVEATGPPFRIHEGEKIEVKKEPAVVARPPSSQMSAAITPIGKESFVTNEEMLPLEQDFSNLLQDLGVKLPNALTKMVFRVDPHDPAKVDDILRRYHIPSWKRQFVVDAWCGEMGVEPVQISLSEDERKRGESSDDDFGGGMDRMMKTMERMATIKMMKEMFMPTQPPPQQQQPQQQQQLVPLFDEEGMPVMGQDGQPVMVPAWQYQMIESSRAKARREAEMAKDAGKPSEMEAALSLAKEFIEMSGSKNDPEMMMKLQEMMGQVQLKELEGSMGRQLDGLQGQIAQQQVVDQVAGQMGDTINTYKKELERVTRELDDQRKDRIRSIQDTQVAMQNQINSVITDGMKEGMGEFRETRRDIKDIAKEQMRGQQLAGQVAGQMQQGPAYANVQELTPAQMEADFAGLPSSPDGEYFFEGAIDDAVTVPDDGNEDRHY